MDSKRTEVGNCLPPVYRSRRDGRLGWPVRDLEDGAFVLKFYFTAGFGMYGSRDRRIPASWLRHR